MTRYENAVATLTKKVGDDATGQTSNIISEITIYLDLLQELLGKVVAGTATTTTYRIIVKVRTKLDEMAEWAESNS
jgi:hypothetical protein